MIDGRGTTVMVIDADLLVSVTEVAATLTVMLDKTEAGALYITAVVVTFVKVPHAAPVHPVPESAQVTPWDFESLETVTEKFFCCPWAIVTAVAGVRETPIIWLVGPGLPTVELPPPHPQRHTIKAESIANDDRFTMDPLCEPKLAGTYTGDKWPRELERGISENYLSATRK